MRQRFILSLAIALLLTASLTNAAVPAGKGAPATSVASSPLDPTCDPLLAELGIGPDPSSAPKDAFTMVCGSCSVTICRGVTYNSGCQGGTNPKRCIAAYGNTCSDGNWQCQCWSGPLP